MMKSIISISLFTFLILHCVNGRPQNSPTTNTTEKSSQPSTTESNSSPKSQNSSQNVTFVKNDVKPLDAQGNYSYDIELSDGTKLVQMGHTVAPMMEGGDSNSTESGGLVIEGSYSYVAPDGKTISISYIADDKGFQPKGDAIPKVGTSAKNETNDELPEPLSTISSPNLPPGKQGIF